MAKTKEPILKKIDKSLIDFQEKVIEPTGEIFDAFIGETAELGASVGLEALKRGTQLISIAKKEPPSVREERLKQFDKVPITNTRFQGVLRQLFNKKNPDEGYIRSVSQIYKDTLDWASKLVKGKEKAPLLDKGKSKKLGEFLLKGEKTYTPILVIGYVVSDFLGVGKGTTKLPKIASKLSKLTKKGIQTGEELRKIHLDRLEKTLSLYKDISKKVPKVLKNKEEMRKMLRVSQKLEKASPDIIKKTAQTPSLEPSFLFKTKEARKLLGKFSNFEKLAKIDAKKINMPKEELKLFKKDISLAKKIVNSGIKTPDEFRTAVLLRLSKARSFSNLVGKAAKFRSVQEFQDLINKHQEIFAKSPIKSYEIAELRQKIDKIAKKRPKYLEDHPEIQETFKSIEKSLYQTPTSEQLSLLSRFKVRTPSPLLSAIQKNNLSVDAVFRASRLKTMEKLGKELQELKDVPSDEAVRVWNEFQLAMNSYLTSISKKIEDTQIAIRKLVETPSLKVKFPKEFANLYENFKLKAGKRRLLKERLETETKFLAKSLGDMARKHNVSLPIMREKINQYMVALHAKEFNAIHGTDAAGITTKEADEIINYLKSLSYFGDLKEYSKYLINLNEEALSLLYEASYINDKMYDLLKNVYKSYVPFFRKLDIDIADLDNPQKIIRAFKVYYDRGSKTIKKAYGSELEVDDVISNSIFNYEQAIQKAIDNMSLIDAANFFRRFKKETQFLGKVLEKVPAKERAKIQEKIDLITFRENGKLKAIQFHNDTSLVSAFRSLAREDVGTILNAFGKISRFFANVFVRFNPAFAPVNKARDVIEATLYLFGKVYEEKGLQEAGAVALRYLGKELTFSNIKDVVKNRGLYVELKRLGGTTGGFAAHTREQIKIDIDGFLKAYDKGAKALLVRNARELFDKLEHWNRIFEDSTRVNVYETLLQHGFTKKKAAFLAKEASVDFDRYGGLSPSLNALYVFFNANVQGSAKMLRLFKSNPKLILPILITVFSSNFYVNQWNKLIDPEWRNKVSEWDKRNSFNIVLGHKGKGDNEQLMYLAIPVSWTLQPFHQASNLYFDFDEGNFNATKGIESVVNSTINAFNPFGGNDFWSVVMPTALDVPVDILRNKAWYGNQIRPVVSYNQAKTTAFFPSLSNNPFGRQFIRFSRWLFNNSGGRIDISPADMYYGFNQMIGGVGKTLLTQPINLLLSSKEGISPEIRDIPMVSRFLRTSVRTGEPTTNLRDIFTRLGKLEDVARMEKGEAAELVLMELSKIPQQKRVEAIKVLREKYPLIFKEAMKIIDQARQGFTKTERKIARLTIKSGMRALAISQILKEFRTEETRKEFLASLKNKQLLDKTILKQIGMFIALDKAKNKKEVEKILVKYKDEGVLTRDLLHTITKVYLKYRGF